MFVTAFVHLQMCLQLPFQSSRFCLLFPILQEQDFHYKEACRLTPHTLVDYLGFLVPVVNNPQKDEKTKANKKTNNLKASACGLTLVHHYNPILAIRQTFYFFITKYSRWFTVNTLGTFCSLYGISIVNSMICSGIWHKYHEWYFKIVICNFTSR